MSFWGIAITKSKPVTHRFDKAKGKLRVPQASFGLTFRSGWWCAVLCSVGGKTPITLCRLESEKIESCPLDIEFNKEDKEVTFSIDHGTYYDGEIIIHLTGYYIEKCNTCGSRDNNNGKLIGNELLLWHALGLLYCNFCCQFIYLSQVKK
ncbi:hypothetical protein MKW98_029721 [Papaver atlanticum]|uniref:Nucleoplasmin-like domain-containing protein n=1 Tax=Papaver atlanticum TaxID=357466 RepID=A0AAD4T3V6_9MAGN|nr:hypothetical protein MKW98_029721 [Papaver atlanticum]